MRSLVSFSLLQALPRALPAQAEETVGPASNFNRIQTGKPRPETGCILVEEVESSGNAKSPTISAELATNGGVAASVAFDSPWPLARRDVLQRGGTQFGPRLCVRARAHLAPPVRM